MMTEPTRIKLKRNESIELRLRESDLDEVTYLYFNGHEVGRKNVVSLGLSDDESGVNLWRASRTSMTVTDSEDACTIVIRMEK